MTAQGTARAADEAWSEDLAAWAEAESTPRLSDATRRQARTLVAIAALTMLLAANLVTVTEGSFGGLTLLPATPAAIALVAGAACLYLLLGYLLDLNRDLRVSRYRRMASHRLGLRVSHDQAALLEEQLADPEGLRLRAATDDATQRVEAAASVEAISVEVAERLTRASREQWAASGAKREHDQVRSAAVRHDLEERSRLMWAVITDTERADRQRTWFEAVFPSVFAALAIVAAFARALLPA